MYVYNSSTFTILRVLHRRVGLKKKYIYIYTVGWKGIFNLWETILEDMFVEQLLLLFFLLEKI